MLARARRLTSLRACRRSFTKHISCCFEISPRAAQGASEALDADRAKIYLDLILSSLGKAARQALMTMDAQKYVYQSGFARKYIAVGRAEGATEGRVALLLRQLAVRFGPIDAPTLDRIQSASIAELDAIGERLLVASTLKEVLEPE